MCQYKANRVVEVEPAYSSINCSRCSHPVPKSLAVRTHVCPKCHAVLDRDYNSALNHLQNGLNLIPAGGAPGTYACGDCNAVGEAGSHGWGVVVHLHGSSCASLTILSELFPGGLQGKCLGPKKTFLMVKKKE
jgi:hypothetical protein